MKDVALLIKREGESTSSIAFSVLKDADIVITKYVGQQIVGCIRDGYRPNLLVVDTNIKGLKEDAWLHRTARQALARTGSVEVHVYEYGEEE